MTSLELLQEIDAWLSFNNFPSKEKISELRNDIKKHISEQLNIADVRRSSLSEPDFRTEKGEWLVWNMLEYGNSIDDACKLLRQKEIVDSL